MTTLSEVAVQAGISDQSKALHDVVDCEAPTCLKQRLLEIAYEQGALRYGNFTLTSGAHSSYYFDGRRLTLDPEGASILGNMLLPLIKEAGVRAIGGPTLGADPIVTAVAMASWQTTHCVQDSIPAFIVRKEAKEHGMGQMIEGPLPPTGTSVAIVDDACTTGGSLFHAISAAEEAGYEVGLVLAVLDRNEGGSEAIREQGYQFNALLAVGDDGRIHPV